MRRTADLFTNDASGVLTIATTHTRARYSLPPVIKAFRELFPDVRLSLSVAHRRKLTCCCKTVGQISALPVNA